MFKNIPAPMLAGVLVLASGTSQAFPDKAMTVIVPSSAGSAVNCKGYVPVMWSGFFRARNMPAPVADKIGKDVLAILSDPALREPPWIAGQARNDIDMDLPKAREIITRRQELGLSMRTLLRSVVGQARDDKTGPGHFHFRHTGGGPDLQRHETIRAVRRRRCRRLNWCNRESNDAR